MNLAACYCTFTREEGGEPERGIAITTAHGLSSVVTIFPANSVSPADAVNELWDYRLDWTHSLYPPADMVG